MNPNTRAMAEIFGETLLADPDNKVLSEAYDKVRALLGREDHGWSLAFGGANGEDQQFGLTLDDLKDWSGKIRPAIVAAPWIGAGFRRRANYIWQNKIRYGNIPKPTRGKKNIAELILDDENQMHFFGSAARRAREECLFADGIAFWIGNEKTKNIEAIPLWQITDALLEPNGLGFAWAYKREWSEFHLTTGLTTKHVRWYFTDRFKKRRVKSIQPKGAPASAVEKVDQDHVIFDQIANGSTGLVYGSPDALAAWIWNGIARDATMDGRAMTQALATFALKASVKDKAAKDGALKRASTKTAGNTAVIDAATDLVPLSTAGKGYDFGSLRFLVAIVASALDISVIHLTANPGDAGSSYGSAQTLDLPTRLAMEARRDEHVDLDKRVLRFMGIEDPDVGFVPYASGEETYRASQALILEYQQDVYTRQELRDHLDDLHGRPNGDVPAETSRPSVKLAKELQKVRPEPTAPAPTDNSSVASPAQGRSNGTGGQSGAANDLRSDTIS